MTFDAPVPGVVAGSERKATRFYNLSACGAGSVVRRNVFGPQRRHALLVRAPNCRFEENVGHGLFNGGSSPILVSCLFANNTGAGMASSGRSEPNVVNCTFVGNSIAIHDISFLIDDNAAVSVPIQGDTDISLSIAHHLLEPFRVHRSTSIVNVQPIRFIPSKPYLRP